jgi:hypothetical protein
VGHGHGNGAGARKHLRGLERTVTLNDGCERSTSARSRFLPDVPLWAGWAYLEDQLAGQLRPLFPQLLPASRRRCPWLEYYVDTSHLVRSCLERSGPPRSIPVPA